MRVNQSALTSRQHIDHTETNRLNSSDIRVYQGNTFTLLLGTKQSVLTLVTIKQPPFSNVNHLSFLSFCFSFSCGI